MPQIADHIIGTANGPRPLLEWVKGHEHRNYHFFDEKKKKQLAMAKKIAEVEDAEARKLMLSLLSEATHLQEVCVEMHKEFNTLYNALFKIEENLGVKSTRPD